MEILNPETKKVINSQSSFCWIVNCQNTDMKFRYQLEVSMKYKEYYENEI